MNFQGWLGNFIDNVSAVIAQGAQLSTAIPLKGFTLAGLRLPSIFTGTALTFFVGDSEDGYQARGQATFSGTCTDGDTLEINGFEITFVDTVTDPTSEVEIGADADETLTNLMEFLDATEEPDLLECTYEREDLVLVVVAVEHGVAGNAFTFAKSSTDITLLPAGGTLAGGGFTQLYDSSNNAVSMTVAQNRAYAVNPALFQGVTWLQIRSGSTELAQRTIICTLKGN